MASDAPNIPDPELVGLIVGALLSATASFALDAEEDSLSEVVGAPVNDALIWLERAGIAEQVGRNAWRINPGLQQLAVPTRPPSGFAEDTIIAWAAAYEQATGLPEALQKVDCLVELPPSLRQAYGEISGMRPTKAAIGRVSLGQELGALEQRGGSGFDTYRRRKLEPDPPTLAMIGEEEGITRERVRQREKSFERLLDNYFGPSATTALATAKHWISGKLGTLAPATELDDVQKVLDELGLDSKEKPYRLALMLHVAGPYEVTGAWVCRMGGMSMIYEEIRVHAGWRGAELDDLTGPLRAIGVSPSLVSQLVQDADDLREISGRIYQWGPSIVEKAVVILRAAGRPMTAEQIFDGIDESKSFRGFKGRLVEPEIRRVGKDMYALPEWGSDRYTTVVDAILADIADHGGSSELEDMMKRLAEKFGVAPGSVRAYAQGPRFSISNGRVEKRESPELPPSRSIEQCPTCFKLESGWAERIAVTHDLLRGSGLAVSLSFARNIGVNVEEGVEMTTDDGPVPFYWSGLNAAVGSLRRFAERFDAKTGDFLFLEITGPSGLTVHFVSQQEILELEGIARACMSMGLGQVPEANACSRACVAVGLEPDAGEVALAGRLRDRSNEGLADLVSGTETRSKFVDALTGQPRRHMSLRDLSLRRFYRSHTDDLLNDFYRPCLASSVQYSRAVGYFSGAALGLAAQGVESFIQNDGQMRIVASPELLARDAGVMEAGYEERERLVDESVTTRLLADPQSDPLRKSLGLLGWLIARERLDIKLAVVERDGRAGIYHEKVGIFEDPSGDRVVFHGSANESHGGLVANFESLMVFCSWLPADQSDVVQFAGAFESLWADTTKNLSLYPFPEAAKLELVRLAPNTIEVADANEVDEQEPEGDTSTEGVLEPRSPTIPEGRELRPYQRAALRQWFSNDARGVLAMATGTGKTFTALAAMTRLFGALQDGGGAMMCIIVCPYQHLVDQWADEVENFGLQPVLCYRSRAHWQAPLAAAVRSVNRGISPIHLAIVTNSTFQTPAFQRTLMDCPDSSLLIADEVHNLGSEGLREALPAAFRYRLGLSATPERHMDPDGTAVLDEFFGGIVFEFGLEQALEVGALTPYEYAVSIVELEGEELELYLDLTRRIGAAIGGGGLDSKAAQVLLVARARVIANAQNKLEALRAAIEPHRDEPYQLVYCGDGSITHDTGVSGVRQIELVVRLLGIDLGMRTQPYTSETPRDERVRIRDRFADGDLQSLVAIRCLDEGVDIPATRRAYVLASSKNPRQYIQRRVRVLRPSPETGKERAYVHDFLAVPPADAIDGSIWETERKLVAGELERVVAFASLAVNGPAAMDSLEDLRSRYELHHL